jgi:hypothetical protein
MTLLVPWLIVIVHLDRRDRLLSSEPSTKVTGGCVRELPNLVPSSLLAMRVIIYHRIQSRGEERNSMM